MIHPTRVFMDTTTTETRNNLLIIHSDFNNVLNDRAGIMETYHSNHRLTSVSDGGDLPEDTKSLLAINSHGNVFISIRHKIISNFFLGPDMDIKPLLRMAVNALPHVVSWIGISSPKCDHSESAFLECNARFNLMYELVRNSPLFIEHGGDGTSVEVQPPESKKQKTDD